MPYRLLRRTVLRYSDSRSPNCFRFSSWSGSAAFKAPNLLPRSVADAEFTKAERKKLSDAINAVLSLEVDWTRLKPKDLQSVVKALEERPEELAISLSRLAMKGRAKRRAGQLVEMADAVAGDVLNGLFKDGTLKNVPMPGDGTLIRRLLGSDPK